MSPPELQTRTFDACWLGMDGIFGGFVLGNVVDAADCLPGFAPQSVTLGFVSVVRPGAVEISIEQLHRGRSTASLRLELRQQGRLRAHAIASLVPSGQQVAWSRQVDRSSWGRPETRPPYAPNHRRLAYGDHLEVRQVGEHTVEDGVAAWMRVAVAAEVHGGLGPHGVAALLLDVLPPSLFALDDPPEFVPTVEFTVHFSPALDHQTDDWVLVTHRTLWGSRDHCVDESVLHDSSGHVLARGRQGRVVRWS